MSEIILIFGRRGTGKTYMGAHLAKDWPQDYIAVSDPKSELLAYDWLVDVEELTVQSMRPGMLIIMDEVDMQATPRGYSPPWIREVFHYSRQYGGSVIAMARRPANVHRDLTFLADHVYLGKITEPRDLKYLDESWGEITHQARHLHDREFIHIVV